MHRPFESMESRVLMAVTASFQSANGILSVIGDALDNTIVVSRDAAGALLINGGAVAISGDKPTVANTARISIDAQGGKDNINLDQTNGALPAAEVFGGSEDDTIAGGASADTLRGEAGNDVLLGMGGFDSLFGGPGNDTLTGGDADDHVFGESDDDWLIWSPGDDTDLNEGGDGIDTSEVNGGNGDEVFTVTANGARVRFDRITPAPFSLDMGTMENLVLNANGGNDSLSCTGNLAALVSISADGGANNDTILGSNGADILIGGDGNDFIDGQQGNDAAFMGLGDDTFQWDPGDGSDTVEGGIGNDTLLFNGSNTSEIFEASPNAGRLRFTRNIGNIVMDTDDVERLDLNALGGADTLTASDLSSADLTAINFNLAGTLGGSTGDGLADTVIVNATNASDVVDVVGAGTNVSVLGLSAQVNITNSEGANDVLVVNALGGSDGLTATTLPAGVVKLTIDGGMGDDSLLGSQGADTLLGGDNDDFVFGDNGNDLAQMGAGEDVFPWEPGDGNDTVEGQGGGDTLRFFGSSAGESVNVLANGGRVLFTRDVANVTMDLDDVETIDYRALGGADNIVIGDLGGTDVTQLNLDLGGNDGAADSITVNGTNAADIFGAAGDGSGVNVFGLQANVAIVSQEVANDRLTLNALGGDDTVDATALKADGILLTINGGLGADTMLGSEGSDLVNGGDGNDQALLGDGDDTFVWNPGEDNDTIEGQAGDDTMLFNGANVAENIDISAVGGRVRFFRNVAAVTMDLDDVETIHFNALGGADNVVVNGLAGTDITTVALNLAATGGAGDGQIDTVTLHGTTSADSIGVASPGSASVGVTGLPHVVQIDQVEPSMDGLTIRPQGGADTLTVENGTSMSLLTIDVGGDSAQDQVILNANGSTDIINVIDTLNSTDVNGLSVPISIFNASPTDDSLRINALGGADSITVNQTGGVGTVRKLLVDGGTELDTITVANTDAAGSATILPSTGNDNVSVNADGLFIANAVFSDTQRIGSLSIGPNGRATIAAGGAAKVLTVSALNITSTGKLDISNHDVIVDYTGPTPLAAILNRLTSGYAGGAWNGNGINSSVAAVDTDTAIGYAEATDLFSVFPGTFKGQSIDDTAVLLSHTLYGDADLSGGVNLDDFNRLSANYNQTNRRWSQGDFDYNNVINVIDFNRLASSYGLTAGDSEADEVLR